MSEDFPTGAWAARKTDSRLKKLKSGKVRARATTGRGVGVKKKARPDDAGATMRHRRRSPGKSTGTRRTQRNTTRNAPSKSRA